MTNRVEVTYSIPIPEPICIERYARMPELGPRILFFSGGTALRPICRELKHYTHNSTHLITPFDSGGSSAELRGAFSMPAVGDLRSRLMSLADESVQGNPATYKLFSYRLAPEADRDALAEELASMTSGEHDLVRGIPEPLRRIVRTHLRTFAEQMPEEFDLRNASIGNLLLAGGYLANERDTDSVVFLFSRLIKTRGLVRPIVDDDVTLFAKTADGRTIAGQHAITNRAAADSSPLVDLWLGKSVDDPAPADCEIAQDIEDRILESDLICFPIGSFFSSILANLLPIGVGRAICDAPCPKVYIPNTGVDSEQRGLSVTESIDHIVRLVRRDAGDNAPIERIIDFVLVDTESGQYQTPLSVPDIESRGVRVLDRSLVDPARPNELEPTAVTHILLSLG